MKYKSLRAFIRGKHLQETYELTGKELVVDGKSFSNSSYKNSECQYLLGGEYDRYANHVRKMIKQLSNNTCYFIFNGAMQENIKGRLELHQRKINEANSIRSRHLNNEYTDVVIFAQTVFKDVLNESGIIYYVSEYEATEAMVTLAKQKGCPILTNNIEMAFYGVSCITPHSIKYDEKRHCLMTSIYKADRIQHYFKIHFDLIPTFLTIVDEDSPAFSVIPLLTKCNETKPFMFVEFFLRWIKRKMVKKAIIDAIDQFIDIEQRLYILESIQKKENIIISKDKTVYEYLKKKSNDIINCRNWFQQGVANGRIIAPFINLKNTGIFSGSWLVSDHKKEDALLPAIDIVLFAKALLSQSKGAKLTFIGRQAEESHAWEIQKLFNMNLPDKAIFKTQIMDLLKMYLTYSLPGFKYNLLSDVPEECWMIIISLVYYCKKRNLIELAYAVLLSYVIVGPVTQEIGIITRSLIFKTEDGKNRDETAIGFDLKRKDCLAVANAVTSFFYVKYPHSIFDEELLHNLSEFQHCWYMMNGLNRLVGERVKCTKFHEAYNGTFVYNIIMFLRTSIDPKTAVSSLLGDSTVFTLFQKIINAFELCLLSVRKSHPIYP